MKEEQTSDRQRTGGKTAFLAEKTESTKPRATKEHSDLQGFKHNQQRWSEVGVGSKVGKKLRREWTIRPSKEFSAGK